VSPTGSSGSFLGLVGAAELVEHDGQVVPGEHVVGLLLDELLEEGQVPQVLGGLVPLVADVLEPEEVAVRDRPALGVGHVVDGGDDPLVHRALEADTGVVAPEPVLDIGGHRLVGPEVDPEGDLGRGPQEVLGRLAVGDDEALVGVDVEHPFAGDLVERRVAGRREVVGPGPVEDPRPMAPGDRLGAVDGSGIDDHDLVDEPLERGQAAVEHGLLVADDESGRDQRVGHGATGTRRRGIGAASRW
jgi:hypothetical protein